MRVITANLNGIRSATRKGFFSWLDTQGADFICVQELKAQAPDLPVDAISNESIYQAFFSYAEKKGYSGVGIFSKKKPLRVVEGIGVPEFDCEGRYIQLDFETFSLISLYAPSGSSSPERQAAKFRFLEAFRPCMDRLMASGREVLICGDWNIAHQEIDLKNWKGNLKNSGFLPEERAWFGSCLEAGWVDVYRSLYPEATETCYTWWSNRGQARSKNVGWRIDCQLATPGLAASALEANVYKADWFSDHAPLTIQYKNVSR